MIFAIQIPYFSTHCTIRYEAFITNDFGLGAHWHNHCVLLPILNDILVDQHVLLPSSGEVLIGQYILLRQGVCLQIWGDILVDQYYDIHIRRCTSKRTQICVDVDSWWYIGSMYIYI